MIFDLSCLNEESVNDHIPVEYGFLQYESFQEALALVASIGRGALHYLDDSLSVFSPNTDPKPLSILYDS